MSVGSNPLFGTSSLLPPLFAITEPNFGTLKWATLGRASWFDSALPGA